MVITFELDYFIIIFFHRRRHCRLAVVLFECVVMLPIQRPPVRRVLVRDGRGLGGVKFECFKK